MSYAPTLLAWVSTVIASLSLLLIATGHAAMGCASPRVIPARVRINKPTRQPETL